MRRFILPPLIALSTLSSNISAEPRSVGDERALKLGVIGLTALNIDEINSTLSRMGNNAVREPIGSVSIDYGYVGWNSSGSIYTDKLATDIMLPIGNDFGFIATGHRRQTNVQSNSSDFSKAALFWKNPKEGSLLIGVSRTGESAYSSSEHHIDLELGYSIRDPDLGFIDASLGKVVAGQYSSIS